VSFTQYFGCLRRNGGFGTEKSRRTVKARRGFCGFWLLIHFPFAFQRQRQYRAAADKYQHELQAFSVFNGLYFLILFLSL